MNKVGISYKKQKVEGLYDWVIIGTGIGAQTAAVLLAKEGKKVLLLERHYTAGGFTHMFKRRGYEWDVGIHYIGEVGTPNSGLSIMFNHLSDGQLEWADMGDVYDRVVFGDKQYNFVKGLSNWKAQMKEYFPAAKDQEAIDKYVELVKASTSQARGYYAEKAMPGFIRWAASPFMRSGMLKFAKRTTREVLEELTDNKELIGVLCGQYGDYGLPPGQSSFAIHAMVAKHYFRGGYYPVGGSSRIIETFAPAIEKAGGAIYTNAEVQEIIIQNGKAAGVKMSDGNEIMAREGVISNAGIYNTYHKLLPDNAPNRPDLEQKATKIPPSSSHLSLYIGLNKTAEELGLSKANYWIYPEDYDHDKVTANYLNDWENNPLPVVYISFPSAKDPDFVNRYPGKATIEIISFAPYEVFEPWEGSRWKKRGDEYEALKEQFAQRMLKYLYKFEPQVKEHIDFYELSTPLSTKHFVDYEKGEIYGLEHTPERFEQKWLKPQTPIKGLYLTGQDIVSVGIGGALFAGVLTASAILKKNVMTDIVKAAKQQA